MLFADSAQPRKARGYIIIVNENGGLETSRVRSLTLYHRAVAMRVAVQWVKFDTPACVTRVRKRGRRRH